MTSFAEQYPIVVPFVAILLAEFAKAFIDWVRHRGKIRFLSSGGMPSGHAAFVSSLVVLMANQKGIGSLEFALSAALALVVMYDAIHLRNEAGKHAHVLNKLLPEAKLEESLGHTHLQVLVGALFGALVAFLFLNWV